MIKADKHLFSYPKYWAECYGRAKFLPMSKAEMDELGWDSCDIIIVTGDAYVDHPSFGMAVIGRFLESQGFRVGIISQPDWNNPESFKVLGEPNLFFGITAGNMDSMINRYTADKKVRNDDAYTPHGEAGKRPDRSVIVYTQKIKAVYPGIPTVIGGIEASLRRIAQYDYWSDEVRRSILIDSAADILLYGNAERAMAEIAHQISMGRDISEITDVPGTAVVRDEVPQGWTVVDSTRIDWPGNLKDIPNPFEANPYEYEDPQSASCQSKQDQVRSEIDDPANIPIKVVPMPLMGKKGLERTRTVIRLPSFEKIRSDSALYAHASRILHLESNPHNAHTLVQKHGTKEVWINTPPIPLNTDEIDGVFDLEYERVPHPTYGDARIPAYEMIRFSVNIMRGCFGGCTFCSITEHEGRVIQSRSQQSVLNEIEDMRDKVPGFTGTVSDLGGPTANMYHLNCKDDEIQRNCRKLSCVFPTICKNLITDHKQTTELYRKARAIPGVKRVAIASGLRYDLAVEDPEYVRELVTHHVGGYLKIAPEHSEKNTLDKMMKPEMKTYDDFKRMFDQFSKEAGKEQYLIPYFIAAHPGCDDEDMLNLALWLKKNKFRVDQVQTFYPSPMSLATAMYHSGKNPLKKVTYKSESVDSIKDLEQRRVQKAFLRYHDHRSWPLLRQALKKLNREELIGDGPNQLIPVNDPIIKGHHKGKPSANKAGEKTRSFSKNRNRRTGSASRRSANTAGGKRR
ncbi:YgiQ family radical SAM protein [Aliikangiella sp. G2MR2-5]|uniref:YgiQ family radical SAM protein n=1 Tax=Aliikangiella sp. G2MR2-5 TaxID=2788943 RepID=UPI0018A928AC|nr:YgiQ family radical SAM protein [Aliikangiella sp. G2MR2-5]